MTSLFPDGIDAVDVGLPFGRRNDECFTSQEQTILNGEGLSVLPVWAEGTRDFLDVLGSASNSEVSKSLHFWIIDEGLLESLFAVWHHAGMMDGNIQWQVRARSRTELRECVWYDHFLTWVVTDCEVVSL